VTPEERALFSGPRPRVRTIPSGAGFLETLAGALTRAFPEPEALAGVTVLLPTRRAGRALARVFAETAERPAALLPMIRPVGDVDADDPPFEPGELAEAAPPAISAARRRFELAQLILAKERRLERRIGAAGALALADHLAVLIDDLHTEETADLSRLTPDIRAELPGHLQEAALFLDIVLEAWPARLAELGAADPAHRRTLLLTALAERWSAQPPEGPVLVAGSTGSIPAAARLMRTVAGLERGLVVLPGLAAFMDARSWDGIDDSHPQFAMKHLLDEIGVDRAQVAPLAAVSDPQREARARLIAEALRPAETTDDWLTSVEALKAERGADVFRDALAGLSLVEAALPGEEARAVALALRETLETPGRTAMVVTPDRSLARRICAEMTRFGVTLDDSAGESLSDTAAGVFLIRVLDAALDPGAAAPLLALAASPVFSLGEARATLRPDFGALERRALRGRRPGASLPALRETVRKRLLEGRHEPDEQTRAFAVRADMLLARIEDALSALLTAEGPQPCAVWAGALTQAAETLAAGEDQSGAARLWASDAGEAAADLMREFLTEASALPPVSLREFHALLLETARARRVRPRYGAHPRLQILGPLEARLQSADRVVLAGLNEGVWPAHPAADPFMSRGMRIRARLSAPERRFGLSAHDFAELAAAPDVILTRSQKSDGAPSVASRWVWRLQTLARGAGAEAALTQDGARRRALARRLDHAAQSPPALPPHPTPPVTARPQRLSVTEIETWVRDPYAIFARHVLKLDALDPIDRPAGPAERGVAYHKALEDWIEATRAQDALSPEDDAHLVELGRAALAEAGISPARIGVETRRFARAAAFIADWERRRRADGWRASAPELKGRLEIAEDGGVFALTGRADRYDLSADGRLAVIDYKSGRAPSAREVDAGFSPQLPLLAAMARAGVMERLDAAGRRLDGLHYVRVSGGRPAGEDRRVDHAKQVEKDAETLADEALARLRRLIRLYADPDTAYPSWPRAQFQDDAGDYDQLARRKEWSRGSGEDVPEPSR